MASTDHKSMQNFNFTDPKNREHDVVDVLSRPIQVWKGAVTSTSTFYVSAALPDIWINANTNIARKLAGFTYLQGDIVARFTVNATPFQCGKYWLFYVPYSQDAGKIPWYDDLAHITAYPGVELDLNSAKVAELRIPLVGPFCPMNLTLDGFGKFGDFYIAPLNQIADGTSAASAHAVLHMWMENVKLFMPTVGKNAHAQMKDESQAAAKTGTLSGIASAVSTLASNVGSAFPSLSSITKPVTWAADIAAGVATYFGFSKPVDLSVPTCIFDVPARGYTNVTGVDAGVVLGSYPQNEIENRTDVFGTDADEMSLNYVCGRPAIFEKGTWESGSPSGTLLTNWPVQPVAYDLSAYVNNCPTPLSYFSSFFRFWTGSICYRITFAKTAFHTGRVNIIYKPYYTNVDGNMEVVDDCYKLQVDLSETSEISFSVPWVSNLPWRQPTESNGAIFVYIQTELNVASDMVCPNIEYNVWHWSHSSFKLAGPDKVPQAITWSEAQPPSMPHAQLRTETAKQNINAIGDVPSMLPYLENSGMECGKASVGEVITSLRQVVKRFTPVAKVKNPLYQLDDRLVKVFPDPDNYVVGMMYDPWAVNKSTVESTVYGYTTVDPTNGQLSDKQIVKLTSTRMNQWQALSQPFRFMRGSMRGKYIVEPVINSFTGTSVPRLYASVTGAQTTTIRPSPIILSVTGEEEPFVFDDRFSTTVHSDNNGVLEWTVPFFNEAPMLLAKNLNSSTTADVSYPYVMITMPRHSNNGVSLFDKTNPVPPTAPWFPSGTLFTACGDDFSFSFLGGCPRFNV